MSQTPTSSSRLSIMNPSLHSLRLTPSTTSANSPYTPSRPSPLRSPTKSYRNELGISLKQVIGSTAASRNAFDSNGRCLAYTAGAAAVVATYDAQARKAHQRFFRAKPTALPLNPTPVVYEYGTPTQTSNTYTRAAPLRHATQSGSPFSTPGRDWQDGSTGKSWSAKERVKAAACVSLSPDGQYLAVGEVGYNPRVIIFSVASDASPDIPLTCLTDHAFGVRCVAFSPDSRYLASLGAANDGFLYIWRINERTGAATLHASNKCTNNVTQILWISNKLVTIGTRHVKVWRVEESNPGTPAKLEESTSSLTASVENRTLVGRNCVLGDLLEATYTCAAAVSGDSAVVCSDKGAVCLLRDAGGQSQFTQIAVVEAGIRAILPFNDSQLLVSSVDGRLYVLDLPKGSSSRLVKSTATPQTTDPRVVAFDGTPDIAALVECGGLIGALSIRGGITICNTDSGTQQIQEVYRLPAHGGPVLGVRAFCTADRPEIAYFTWAGNGSVMLWNGDGSCARHICTPVEQRNLHTDGIANELRVVRYMTSKSELVTGDRLGVLRMCAIENGIESLSVRAHSAEISDIAIHDGEQRYIASAGRDRVIQVFHEVCGRWELLQTLDEHVGAVTGVAFSKDGERLLSCSSDRTVVVRERASRELNGASEHAFIISRTITLKSTPLAMVFDPIQENLLHLSTIDRFVHRYDYSNGKLLGSFKTGDSDGGDTVIMSALVAIPAANGGTILAGLSSTDKSIRLYDESGVLLARDWGHTEGVADIAVLPVDSGADMTGQATLVTVALDGTIFTWQADLRPPKRYDALSKALDLLDPSQLGTPGTENSLFSRPPLRRVLSQSEVASFRSQTSPESEDTPTRASIQRSPPRPRRQVSRMSMLSTPKLEATPSMSNGRAERGRRRSIIHRSPSPPSPKLSAATLKRRKSMHPDTNGHTLSKARSASNLRESTSAVSSPLVRDTESTCRNLRIYRKKLTTSADIIPADALREVQKELSLTLRAVGEKAMRPKASQVDEEVLGRVLDQYSAKLVEMLDTRLASLTLGASSMGGVESASNESLPVGSSVLDSPIQEHAEEQSPKVRNGSV